MFKSQNGRTWTSEQNEDVKFKIKSIVVSLQLTQQALYILVNDVMTSGT